MTDTGTPNVPAMRCWPALEPFGRTIRVPRISDSLFLYDSAAGTPPGAQKMRLPVVLVHGLGDEADSWRHLFPLLAKRRRVLALDLPGFGRSAATSRARLSAHAKAVRALLGETGPAILAGSSMGAAVAELVAFAEPEAVRALICIDGGLPSGGTLPPALLASIIPGPGERGYRAYRTDDEAAYRSLAPYYADIDGLSPADRAFLRERVRARVASETQLRAYFSSFRSFIASAAFRRRSFRKRLASSRLPLLVVWGEKDVILPLPTRGPIIKARPDASLAVIEGAGHLPFQEKPEQTAAAIEGFLDSAGL